jgi:tetratricopeptide (TPR) repeat protein
VAQGVWAAHTRACAAVGGEGARVDAVTRHIGQLSRAAEALEGDEAISALLETARQYDGGLGQTERATGIVEALFEMDPTRADVWLYLRDLYRELGTSERLVVLAESVLWSKRSSEVHRQVRLDLSRALLENPAKVDRAIVTLKGILEEEPNDVVARDALADALEREGRHEELVEVLTAGLGLVDPARRRTASMRLGRALERASRTAEAAVVYVRLANDDAASVEELRVIATRLHALGSEHLPDCLERLLRRESGTSAVELSRRLLELRAAKQDRPGVVRALSAGFALKPDDPQFREGLLQNFEEDRRWAEVIAVLERALACEPSNRALLQRLVDAHQRAADFDGALDVLGQALRGHPSDADLLRQRGWLYEAGGRLDDAIAELEKAYAIDRSLADDLIAILARAAPGEGGRRSIELVDLLVALDRLSDARSVVEVLLERMPELIGGLERLAALAAAEGDATLALELYRELAKLGRLDEAETTFRKLPRDRQGHAAELVSNVHLERAHHYLETDDLVEAFDCLKRAFAANPKNDEASFLLGLVAIDLDDHRTALRALRAASASRSALGPESKAVVLHQLARLAPGAGGVKRSGFWQSEATIDASRGCAVP